MTTTTIDVREARPANEPNAISCHSCRASVPLYEVFDGWDQGVERDCCPRCTKPLLAPLAVPA